MKGIKANKVTIFIFIFLSTKMKIRQFQKNLQPNEEFQQLICIIDTCAFTCVIFHDNNESLKP
jgi:hypothetical protein